MCDEWGGEADVCRDAWRAGHSRNFGGQKVIKIYKNPNGTVDFGCLREGRVLAPRARRTVGILIFRCLFSKNVRMQNFKKRNGTVGSTLRRDRLLADHLYSLAVVHLVFRSC